MPPVSTPLCSPPTTPTSTWFHWAYRTVLEEKGEEAKNRQFLWPFCAETHEVGVDAVGWGAEWKLTADGRLPLGWANSPLPGALYLSEIRFVKSKEILQNNDEINEIGIILASIRRILALTRNSFKRWTWDLGTPPPKPPPPIPAFPLPESNHCLWLFPTDLFRVGESWQRKTDLYETCLWKFLLSNKKRNFANIDLTSSLKTQRKRKIRNPWKRIEQLKSNQSLSLMGNCL